MLLKHRTHSEFDSSLLGRKFQHDDLVFDGFDRKPHQPDSLSAAFQRAAIRAELPGVRFNVARHTHASLFLARRRPPEGSLIAARPCLCGLHPRHLLANVMPGLQEAAAEALNQIPMPRVTRSSVYRVRTVVSRGS
jgi:hypothetical protein